VHFPWLAGEVLSTKKALAVSEESRRGWLVYRASGEARQQGVWPGMTVSAASVMCPGLAVERRRPHLEQKRLAEIGDWMLSFSPVVSVQPPETVLLEVRGSLGLFGGVEGLKASIGRRLDTAGHVYRIAGAPVPSAAKCLARWGREVVITDKPALRSALGDMPIGLLALEPKTAARLERAGMRVLRDLWRLPADGLARRFGAALVRELDRLRGGRPDPQPLHESPLRFSAVLMLDWATDDLAQVKQGVEHLLRQWTDYLHRSARATSGFSIECLPDDRADGVTRVDIGMRRLSRDRDHLRRLAGERLDRLRLPGPVAGLVLASDRIHPIRERSRQLFETDEDTAMQWRQSEELLAMRLGGRGLDTLHTVADHRPGLAWGTDENGSGSCLPSGGQRPLWLLDSPRPLPWPRHWPAEPFTGRHAPKFLRGPERIETGWWDRRDQRRDYYVVMDSRGRRLWVFRDLRRRQWYLHGLFA
jgi:protein ImuB